jgi:hypothetical protein
MKSRIAITCVIIALILMITGYAGDLKLGGYLESRVSLLATDTVLFPDNQTFRFEASRKLGKSAAFEAHLIFSTSMSPLDPFANFKESSVFNRIIQENIDASMPMVMEMLDSVMGDSTGADLMNQIMDDATAMKTVEQLYYSSYYPRDKLLLDRTLIKLYFNRFDLYIGKQKIAWGTGYAWNPTDIWNIKSPLDATAPSLGVNAVRAEIPLGRLGQIAGLVKPGMDVKHTSGGLRIKQNIKGFDLSLCGAKIMTHDRHLLGLPKKLMLGMDMAGQIPAEIGVWAEVAYNNMVYDTMKYTDFDSAFLELDAGMDYTFSNGLYVMLEYYFNGKGKGQATDYDLETLIYMMSGEISGMGRNYLFTGTRMDFLELFTGSLFIISNLDDKSLGIMPSVDYDFTDGISLNLGATAFVGDEEESEYGAFYSSLFFKITGYF